MKHDATNLESLEATVSIRDRSLPETAGLGRGGSTAPLSAGGAAPDTPSAPGGAKFAMRRMIARGGMGEVWEATQSNLSRVVAVKRVRRDRLDPGSRADALADFHHEALTAARLEHPNIVPVHDFASDAEGAPLLAMKLVQGKPWDQLLAADRLDLDPDEFLARHIAILVDMAQAVAFAHSRGIVHRDLKPSQVMVGEYGEVLLMDWGLAMFVQEDSADTPAPPSGTVTAATASSPAGTPALMAPEQTRRSAEGVGYWTDIYLLGGTLYNILTATYPHEAPTAAASLQRASRGEVVPPAERAPALAPPAELCELAMRCLAPAPADRPRAVTEVVEALQGYLTGSTRRKEAAALLRRTERMLAGSPGSYDDFAQAKALVQQAQSLWPASPEVRRVADLATEAQARHALRAGDLALARIEAENLPPGHAARAGLLAEAARAQAAAAARERSRRALRRGVVALLALIALGAGLFSKALADREGEARAARAVAEESARKALAAYEIVDRQVGFSRELVDYLLEDLAKSLDPRNARDSELAIRVAEEIRDQCLAVDYSGWPLELQLEHADFLIQIGFAIDAMGLGLIAEEFADASLRIRAAHLPPDDIRVLNSRFYRATYRSSTGGTAAAITELEEVVALLDHGRHPPALTVRVEHQLGVSYFSNGRGDLAAPLMEALLVRYNDAELAEGGTSRAAIEGDRMSIDAQLGDYLGVYRRALEMEAQADVETPEWQASQTANMLVIFGMEVTSPREILPRAESSHRVMLANAGPDHPATLRARVNLLVARYRGGDGEAVLPEVRELLATYSERHGERSDRVAIANMDLALILLGLGRGAEALPHAQTALSIRTENDGADSPQLGNPHQILAQAHDALRNDELAEFHYREAARVRAPRAPNHPQRAEGDHLLGEFLRKRGRIDEAVPLLEAALRHRLESLGPASWRVPHTRLALAKAYLQAGRPEDAAPLLAELGADQRDEELEALLGL
ncbi:MAG: serine/threonine-protein kinase [Candidatus Sumerlaeia bacterium]|nr:serine/threonine-protein kinase [Candidatus Sumerlaeia bacterium]